MGADSVVLCNTDDSPPAEASFLAQWRQILDESQDNGRKAAAGGTSDQTDLHSVQQQDWFDKETDAAQIQIDKGRVAPKFRFFSFLWTILDHIFFPVSLLWMVPRDARYGPWRALRNQWFLPMPGQPAATRVYAAGSFGMNLLIWAAHGFLWMSSRPHHHQLWPLLLATDILFVMRASVVAIKYAYMSRSERLIVRFGEWHESLALNRAMQIMSSFAEPTVPQLLAEVHRTALSVNATFGLDVRSVGVPLAEGSSLRLRARIAHDLHRLRIDPKYADRLADHLLQQQHPHQEDPLPPDPPDGHGASEAGAAPTGAATGAGAGAGTGAGTSTGTGAGTSTGTGMRCQLTSLIVLMRLAAQPRMLYLVNYVK
jgi:hypothetical protein